MPDLNALAKELGDLGREEADLMHRQIAIHRRRCELLNELGKFHVARGDLDSATLQPAAQKKPPPNP